MQTLFIFWIMVWLQNLSGLLWWNENWMSSHGAESCRYEQLFFCYRQESSTWSQPSSTWWQPSPQWEWWVLLLQMTADSTHIHFPYAEGSACYACDMSVGHSPVRHHTAELPERGRTVQGQEIWGGKGSGSLKNKNKKCIFSAVILFNPFKSIIEFR